MPNAATTALVLCDFVSSFERDCANGRLRSLSEYLARYPGHEAAIAREHAALHSDNAARATLPERFGCFEVRGELARGGQGRVYRAWDPARQQPVAVKALTLTGGADQIRRARFRREVAILGRLDHPHICRLYAANVDHDPPYVAMELVPGATLEHHIADHGGPAADTAPVAPGNAAQFRHWLQFFATCARTLFALHTAGIVHRDIKPANLMVTPDGAPCLLDFGAARDCSDPSSITRPNLVLGTRPYLAPELLEAPGHDCSPRGDQFALGVTMFESLARRRPDGGTAPQQLIAGLFDEPTYAWLPRRWAVALGAILSRTLDPAPAWRHRDCLALASSLQQLLDQHPALVRWRCWQQAVHRQLKLRRNALVRLLQPALWLVLPMFASAGHLAARQQPAGTSGGTTTLSAKPLP